MDFKFKPGDLVKVKPGNQSSGYPFMTIVAQTNQNPPLEDKHNITGDFNWYICRWYYQGEFKTGVFREEELTV